MPKYEYACRSCGERLEVLQSFADAPLTECPACAGPLRRVFSAPGIAFKGSGFYRTDNRKRRKEPKDDKVVANADSSSTNGTSDAKPETKTDTKAEPAKKDTAASTASSGDATPKAAEAKSA